MPMTWYPALCHWSSSLTVRWPVRLVPTACFCQVSVARTLAVQARRCHSEVWAAEDLEILSVGVTWMVRVDGMNCISCCLYNGGKHAESAGCVVCIQVQSTSCGLVASWWSFSNWPACEVWACCMAHLATRSANSFQAWPLCPRISWMVIFLDIQSPRAQQSLESLVLDLQVVVAVDTVRLRDRSGRMQACMCDGQRMTVACANSIAESSAAMLSAVSAPTQSVWWGLSWTCP